MKHKKELSVLYIITKLELGGAQKVCLSLFEGVHEQGIQSFLLSSADGKLVDTVINNPRAILLPALKREIALNALFQEFRCFLSMITTIKKLKKKHPGLIVHTHSTKAGIMGRWAAFFAGVHQRIHTVHGYAFHDHQSRLAWWIIYLTELMTSFVTTHFVCVSSEDVRIGIKLFPWFAKKHSIIRAAVDWHQFYQPVQRALPTPSATEPFIIGTVACFKPQKNLFDLLRAIEKVYKTDQRIRLEIVGDGELRPAIELWLQEHKLSHIVTLHGWQDKVAPFMMTWHAFALSSLWEGLPCAVVEARLLKLPVISYTTGGIADVITHGTNGLLCAQKEWHTLADLILSLMHNPALYTQLQAHGDDLYDFKNSSMVSEHCSLYQALGEKKYTQKNTLR
jgi:glycosyltransferase involved in cell wall biosynthesis